ncbi:MAG: copper homeostasis protein CutC [Anaerolineae bacterium]|nr:copper homeostasis protein CutC [Anaerolineae bacterium]
MSAALEIIVLDADDAIEAAAGGATALEVVRDLEVGGLTPDLKTLAEIRAAVCLPLNVMVRPHARDFVYSPDESAQILRDAEAVTRCGADGVVFGALTAGGEVDLPLVRRVKEVSRAVSPAVRLTFHRAIEAVADADAALPMLRGLADRVLVSGLQAGQGESRELLGAWVRRYGADIHFACGGGVTLTNARQIVLATGVPEVHLGGAVRTDRRVERAKVAAVASSLQNLRRSP